MEESNPLKQDIEGLIDHKVRNRILSELKIIEDSFQKSIEITKEKDEVYKASLRETDIKNQVFEYTERIISNELKSGKEINKRNFAFVYNQNVFQNTLLFPKLHCLPNSTEKEVLSFENSYNNNERFMIDPYSWADEEEEKLIELKTNAITETFLEEGILRKEIMSGPFKERMFYLFISGAFFYKIFSRLN